ncbi:DNA-directed RNA polymerase subunit D [Methanobacterium alcaliphilum]|uniref:DNA-directed RNA polymerase subunit D n=1 Tax=Methanobacterium alcaliphilum TaxID=392018 RepID=UPI002009F7D1|nr:DNA-directed RNA polymerase subunit D [Methanobacterium alcaliphilum]MCK9151344.1 DNA-directed RNA polymerase subunit D [Methanobacterium alcaliphilum]
MEIDVKEKNGNELVFVIEDVDVTFVNAIRRICMMEIPKMAIEDVYVVKNDSAMFDEVLAHRLGLIPLVSDSESIETLVMPDECDCEDYCPKCTVSLVLKKKGPGVVYSKDLSSEDSKIKPVYDTIPLLKLKDNQEVELEAIAQLGIGIEHAKWEPTTACAYKFYPQITIDENCDECQNCVEACPRGVLEFDQKAKKVEVVDLENCSMCKSCVRVCDTGAINIGYQEGKFIFIIETDGSIPPEEVLLKACDVLFEKADKIVTFCEGG